MSEPERLIPIPLHRRGARWAFSTGLRGRTIAYTERYAQLSTPRSADVAQESRIHAGCGRLARNRDRGHLGEFQHRRRADVASAAGSGAEPSGIGDAGKSGRFWRQRRTISYPDYRDFRDKNRTFEGLIASNFAPFGFSPDATARPKVVYGTFVSGNFFHSLRVQPSLGRGFLDSEDQAAGRDAVVVLGHDFWVSQFNASPSVIGSTMRLNGVECRIIGVAPEGFIGLDNMIRPALFVPMAMLPRLSGGNPLEQRDLRWFTVKGRLKPGVSVAQANADLGAIAARLEELYPETNRNQKVQVETELQFRVKQVPPQAALAVMQSVLALCVLLVACANVAGLLLSRARARSREMAVRLAIGAGRGALVRQLLLENLLLALAGGLAGILLAYSTTDFFNAIPIPTDVPVSLKAAIDQRVLFFTLAASILSTFLFGLAPALQTTRVDLVPALKALDADSSGRRRLWGQELDRRGPGGAVAGIVGCFRCDVAGLPRPIGARARLPDRSFVSHPFRYATDSLLRRNRRGDFIRTFSIRRAPRRASSRRR